MVSEALRRVVVCGEVKEEGRYSGPGDMSGTQRPGAVITRRPMAVNFLGKTPVFPRLAAHTKSYAALHLALAYSSSSAIA